MSTAKTQSRAKRSPSGDTAKKIVSLTVDPALISQVDGFASDTGVSRSAALETIIREWLAKPSGSPVASVAQATPMATLAASTSDNSLVQSSHLVAYLPSGAAINY